jgi:hypothetical protein
VEANKSAAHFSLTGQQPFKTHRPKAEGGQNEFNLPSAREGFEPAKTNREVQQDLNEYICIDSTHKNVRKDQPCSSNS